MECKRVMKIAHIGNDYCIINEDNIEEFVSSPKMHLIKMDFENPTETLIKKVLNLYPSTNRFIVSDNIRVYNYALKDTTKKYYVENRKGDGLITFFKRNNKCVLNFENLTLTEREFVFSNILEDVLCNVEAIIMHKKDFINRKFILEQWSGNVLMAAD